MYDIPIVRVTNKRRIYSEKQLVQNRWYILQLKLHVSAFTVHLQVSKKPVLNKLCF